MTAYLNAAIDTKANPPTVIGWRVMSERASSVTRLGNGVEWAQIYELDLGHYDESSSELERICRESFTWVYSLTGATEEPDPLEKLKSYNRGSPAWCERVEKELSDALTAIESLRENTEELDRRVAVFDDPTRPAEPSRGSVSEMARENDESPKGGRLVWCRAPERCEERGCYLFREPGAQSDDFDCSWFREGEVFDREAAYYIAGPIPEPIDPEAGEG